MSLRETKGVSSSMTDRHYLLHHIALLLNISRKKNEVLLYLNFSKEERYFRQKKCRLRF